MIKLRFILPSVLLLVALCWAYLEEFPRLEMEDTCFGSKHVKIPPTMNDKFADLLAIAQGRVDENSPKNHEKVVIHEKLNSENPTFAELTNFVFRWHSTNLELFQYSISKNEMYPENEKVIKHLLKDLKTLPVYFIEYHEHYTEHFKIFLYLQTETRAIMKPGRAKRDEHAHPNHFYWDDYDRHNAEIAAYHLDRILGFRRAIPHVGRYVNIMEEIYPFAFDELLKTFYVTPGGNNCMTGRCENYCDTNHPTCGNPNIIEASLAASLPTHDNATRDVYKHPWKRSFDKKRQAIWEVDQNYCDTIRNIKPFKSGKRILDIVDLAIMDFLTGNMNRKYYEMFKIFGDDAFIIHSEFGQGFNRPNHDEVSILAPLQQCCTIRSSTLKTLIKYHTGSKKLSAALRDAMSSDPLTPILLDSHLEALDRRVALILETVRNCMKTK